MRCCCALILTLGMVTSQATAQAELSLYGVSSQPADSTVSGDDPGGSDAFHLMTGWSAPPASGVRVTYWQENDVGFGVDVNTTGVVADAADIAAGGISELALENGTSIVTLNAYRRWDSPGRDLTPYVGAGVGLSVPQLRFDGGGTPTDSKQLTGPAMQVVAGARIAVGENVSVFGEMQSAYSINRGSLDSGGSIDTNVLTNGLNFGITLGF